VSATTHSERIETADGGFDAHDPPDAARAWELTRAFGERTLPAR